MALVQERALKLSDNQSRLGFSLFNFRSIFALPVIGVVFAGHLKNVVAGLFGIIPVDTVEGGKYRRMSPGFQSTFVNIRRHH